MPVYKKVLLEAVVLEIAFKAFIVFKIKYDYTFLPFPPIPSMYPYFHLFLTNLLPLFLCEICVCVHVCAYIMYIYMCVCL